MNWIEAEQLPQACEQCREQECYNCEVAAQRWVLTEQAKLRIRRNVIRKEIERLLVELSQIERKLEGY